MSGGTAGVRGTGAECRKFAPNIFNKSKCSSCFKQKEEHSAEALECNRATRKISKCGYLFVAPGWDFSNPLNRTKRWQRRWFVLYDDGELTYSVDEHPETVPQARIDMTRVLEVAAAEDITGHPYSLAVTSPEGVTFVKGTCREETRWWADVLQVYSRNKGRHKRNATFPGGQTTILQVTPTIRSNTPNPPRPRFNSCRSEPRSNTWIPEISSSPSPVTNSVVTTSSSPVISNGNSETSNEHRNNSASPLRTSAPLENGSSYLSTAVPSTSTMNGTVVSTVYSTTSTSTPSTTNSASLTEKPPIVPNEGRSTSYRDQPASSASPPTRDKLRAEDKARRRMNQHGERASTGPACSTEKLDDDACRRIFLEHEREREGKLRDIAASLTQPRVRRIKPRTSEPTRDVVDAANAAYQDKLIRGDPDGCGLDISGIRYSPTSELRVDLPAEDLLNIKKGWLMKQGLNKEWNKHWFVLRGCGLMYYRDPCAEDKGIMDGVIDLNTVTAVTPLQVARNYGFQTVAWDDRGSTVLSAVTAGIRASWMSAIRRAANLPDPDSNVDSLAVCQDGQQDSTPQSPTASITDRERDSVVPSTSVTPRSVLFSSDEEYRTASEGGRRESGDWSEVPVSPPLVRNVALDHNRSIAGESTVYKRSRSSPPSSRRSTLDSVSLKSQLNAARTDVANAEKELARLRQQKAEASIREKQVDELLNTIQRTEQQRNKDLEDLEKMKKMYTRDKEMLECKLLETEAILRETNERCEMLTKELASSHRTVEHLQAEIASLSDRLSRGIEENERLYTKVRELEEKGGLSSSRERGRSFDSLSDLTNIELDLDLNSLDKERIMEEYDELRSRFEKAILEIRAMRKELREAHAMQDALELEIFAHKQDAAGVSETNQAQAQLMAARIQDLTNKLAASEKQVRTLKQKLTKAETRDKRRSLSLKGRELSTLETKVANVAENMASDAEKDSSECSEVSGSSTSEVSLEIIARLRKLERVVSKSKRRLEKCLGSTQAEDKAEKCLREVNDILDSCLECKKSQASAQVTDDYMNRLTCKQCDQLQETIKRITVEHNEELDMLKRNQEQDLMDIKGELDNQRHSLTCQYEQEAASLRDKARKLEHRLNAMDSEHSAHVNELRAAYQRSMSAELDTDAETRKRYKEEIKQLRGLCEKGLLAMENSHRRIISEMEEKHRQELENLRVEKEQALSEETQATLAALDAMRKAHEHEVQKEIAKFKQEFLKQMQAREDIGVLHKEHEEEMEEIKQEILSLSAKYSSKCVESAALEEKVGSLTKQLAQAQQHIMQLDARNKQLRAHLVLETNDTSINDSMHILRGRENEITEPREEIHRLQQLKHGEAVRDTSGGAAASKTSSLLNCSPAYSPQRVRTGHEPLIRAGSCEEQRRAGDRGKSSLSTLQKSVTAAAVAADRPAAAFSYKVERIKSVSLPYSSNLVRPGSSSGVPSHDRKEVSLGQKCQERNGLASPLWDSLRPRSGLPHQYQGGTAEMRAVSAGTRWQDNKQTVKQQQSETFGFRVDNPHTSRLTPEPAALSVAELMRSPAVRWSSRSCRSLPPTPTPSYHHPLHPPLPAVGMVAERKKRFEL
ncbi:Protein outspread [Dufourea novaeangliae]|uniref:Protein outspread n=1 Tax=Dufourea novaeangliae TaxID=178035 RepID=A0A154PN33_DUFNO|nr:Protein outspread [Dufourea novaeangliae]